MKNNIHKPIIKKKQLRKNYFMTLIYKSIFVLSVLLILLIIKKINISSTNNIIEKIRKNISYEFSIVDDGKKIYTKAQDMIDDSIKTISVFNPMTPKYNAPIAGSLYRTFDYKVKVNNEFVNNGGIDIEVDGKDEPTAIVSGKINKIEKKPSKGYFVTIQNDNMKFIYGYLSKAYVTEGTEVEIGDIVGELGTNKNGKKYLRFEIQIDGVAVDPLDYIDF